MAANVLFLGDSAAHKLTEVPTILRNWKKCLKSEVEEM